MPEIATPAPRPLPSARVPAVLVTLVALVLLIVGASLSQAAAPYPPAPYSELIRQIDAHQVKRAVISNKAHTVKVRLTDGRRELVTFTAAQSAELRAKLKAAGAKVKFARQKKKSGGGHPLRYAAGAGLLLLVAAGGGFYVVSRRRQVADPVRDDPAAAAGPPREADRT
ncbi:MAG TPA: ATP-dependent metallopeptidase FtsH/Yme1/Tma family protein [Solirubrobacteraceae bacterium]|jgi:ATP-dependent Zn protease|nr:ATP-dependent metallopeptidase FtsH/Yme1/Tma family protein [Solirubrobacteraceae bacterium]